MTDVSRRAPDANQQRDRKQYIANAEGFGVLGSPELFKSKLQLVGCSRYSGVRGSEAVISGVSVPKERHI